MSTTRAYIIRATDTYQARDVALHAAGPSAIHERTYALADGYDAAALARIAEHERIPFILADETDPAQGYRVLIITHD